MTTAEILINELPKNDENRNTLDQLEKRATHIQQALDPMDGNSIIPGRQTTGAILQAARAEQSIQDDSLGLVADQGKFARALLKDAEMVKERNRAYATYAGWASVFFYVVGWGMGLLGKLFGIEGLI